jgi:hypothetical protein
VGVAVALQAHEGGAAEALARHQPARQLGRQRGLPLAALAAEDGVALPGQEALGPQHLAASAHEAVGWRFGQGSQGEAALCRQHLPHPLGGHLGDELGVPLLLEEHGHEPVGEAQLAGEGPAAVAVREEGLLAREHRLADAAAGGQLAVEDGGEAPGRLHQHRVAHGRHRGHPLLQKAARHRGRGLLVRGGALAGLEEEEGHTVAPDEPRQLLGVDHLGAAPVELGRVFGPLDAEGSQALLPVVDAVAVEVDGVVGLPGLPGPTQLLPQGGEGGGSKMVSRARSPRPERASTSGRALARWSM